MITVVNKHTHAPTINDFFVGRGSVLGNPYSSIQGETKAQFICNSKEESLAEYYKYICEKITQKDKVICDELNKIWKIAKSGVDINLVCYCAPKSCHANMIKKIVEDKLRPHKTYKGRLTELKPSQIAIVGTNTEGRFGAGFAKYCVEHFDAKHGIPRGMNGRCYGIVTKDLTKNSHPSRTPEQIKEEIKRLYKHGSENPQSEYVSPYNCRDKNFNFYSAREMASFFGAFEIPSNFVFEEDFYKLVMSPPVKDKRDIDGVSHINVYSKGNTLLGRLLSNFAETRVIIDGGVFASLESWWYWIKMTNINETSLLPLFLEDQMEEVKMLPGNAAKSYFRKLYKDDSKSFSPTKEQYKKVCRLKLEQHPNITELLLKNELPFRHYYVMYDKIIEATDYLWTLEVWSELKEEFKKQEHGY